MKKDRKRIIELIKKLPEDGRGRYIIVPGKNEIQRFLTIKEYIIELILKIN